MPLEDSQTTNRQHAVPQNVMDVEFKIIGDLTMRQFFYLAIAGIFAYSAFTIISIPAFKYSIAGVILLFGIAFAFIPFEERSIDQWIVNVFKAIYAENQSVWRKEPQLLTAFSISNLDSMKQELITLAPTSSRRKLEDYLDSQYTHQKKDPLDIDELKYIKKVRNAFSETRTKEATASEIIPPTPTHTPQIQTEGEETTANAPQRDHKKPGSVYEESAENTKQREIEKLDIKLPKIDYTPLEPITPDRHSGRKFTNLLPRQGEIVLPIRGEKMLKTAEEEKIEEDIQTKTENLRLLLEQIRREEGLDITKAPSPKLPSTDGPQEENHSNKDNDVEDTLNKLEEENKKLNAQILNLQNEMQNAQQQEEIEIKEREIKALEEQKQRKEQNYENIKVELTDLKEKVFVKKAITEEPIQPQAHDLDGKPNILRGKIHNTKGEGLESVVLIVKNQRGEPIRALKTNKLGDFAISTPVANGTYSIEFDKTNKTGLSFDIMEVEARGVPLGFIDVIGK